MPRGGRCVDQRRQFESCQGNRDHHRDGGSGNLAVIMSERFARPRHDTVESALREGGRVTLLDPADAVDLRDAGGVAAILRW